MEYTQAVAEIRRLNAVIEDAEATAEQASWDRARLTWEQLQAGHSQTDLARDAGVAPRSIYRWAGVYDRFGRVGAGARPSYSEAFQAVDKGLEPEGVYAERHQQEAERTIRSMAPERKAEVVTKALEDPEVAERVVRGPARAPLARAETKVEREREQLARERYELAEPRSTQIGAMTAGEYDLTKARRGFEDALDNAETLAQYGWPDESRERFTALTRRALAAGEALLATLEGRNLDAELQALLEGGEG